MIDLDTLLAQLTMGSRVPARPDGTMQNAADMIEAARYALVPLEPAAGIEALGVRWLERFSREVSEMQSKRCADIVRALKVANGSSHDAILEHAAESIEADVMPPADA